MADTIILYRSVTQYVLLTGVITMVRSRSRLDPPAAAVLHPIPTVTTTHSVVSDHLTIGLLN